MTEKRQKAEWSWPGTQERGGVGQLLFTGNRVSVWEDGEVREKDDRDH